MFLSISYTDNFVQLNMGTSSLNPNFTRPEVDWFFEIKDLIICMHEEAALAILSEFQQTTNVEISFILYKLHQRVLKFIDKAFRSESWL